MDLDGDAPPFWSPPPTTVLLPRRRRTQPSPLISPVALILAVPILILLALFFLVPPFLSHTNQILRPHSVRKSWDSLNIVLVLFAILCGVFARRNEEALPPEDAAAGEQILGSGVSNISNFVNRPSESVSSWMDFPDRKEYNRISTAAVAADGGGGVRLRRSSSSYPDLRQDSLWESGGGNYRSRFFDDFNVNFHRSPPREDFERRRPRRSHEAEREEPETVVREIPVDKFEVSSAQPAPTPPKWPAPPPPPPPPPTLKRRRSVHSVPRKENVERRRDVEAEISENRRPVPPPAPPPPPPPPPPSPPPPPAFQFPGETTEKIHRKKSGTTKEIATAIASLYKGKRKRKNREKTRVIYDTAGQASPPPSTVEPQATPPRPPPPPPPPPPPSKVLQNLFRKSGKSKRVHSVPTTAPSVPPPPPPPPPNSIFNNIFKTGSKSKRFQRSSTAPPPPPPPPPSSILNSLFKTGSMNRRFKNVTSIPTPPPPPPPAVPPRRRHVNTGKPPKPTKPSVAQYHESVIIAPPSPLIPLPPPPPPPPFKMSEAKFLARGEFVRILSAHSSRCSSPELEDVDVMSVKSDGGDSVGPSNVSCPSPDVNVKADTFIARLRDEWRLEKINSIREKRKSG